MNNDKMRQAVNVIALVAMVAFNFISEAIPLNNLTSAQIANRYPDLLYFPANYAFGIWSVIYTFLIAFGIYQALPGQRANPALHKIGYLFAASCAFNVAWLAAFHFLLFPLSMIFMILLLGMLMAIYIRLEIGLEPVSRATKWLIHIPFSLYLGWITAATITNAAYVLTDGGWNGFGLDAQSWALMMLAVTGVLGAGIVFFRRDVAYGAVIIWAVSAIAVRHAAIAPVQTAAIAVSVVVAAVILYVVWTWLDSHRLGWSM